MANPLNDLLNAANKTFQDIRYQANVKAQPVKQYLAQPVPKELQPVATGLEKFFNTKVQPITIPSQFISGYIQGGNLGLTEAAYRAPETTGEKIAFGAGTMAGAMNPYTLSGKLVGGLVGITNPIMSAAVKPLSASLESTIGPISETVAKAFSPRIASGVANVAQGSIISSALGRPTTAGDVAFDFTTGTLLGPNQFKSAPLKADIADVTDLVNEAKKYKSAEEFIKAQSRPYYHGTRNKWSGEFRQPTKGEYLSEAIFVAPSESSASYYDRGGGIKETYIKKGSKLWNFNNELDKNILEGLKKDKDFVNYVTTNWNYTLDEAIQKIKNGEYDWVQRPEVLEFLRKKGFDGFINIDHGGGETIGVFSNKNIFTKEYLTDIYNQAKQADSLEALKLEYNPNNQLISQQNILRGTKNLTEMDIQTKLPDIQLKRDVPATDIYGNKVKIPEGEALTPYELKGNKVLLQDGQPYLVNKNQFQNIKSNAVVGEAKPFAPELDTLEEKTYGKQTLSKERIIKGITQHGNKYKLSSDKGVFTIAQGKDLFNNSDDTNYHLEVYRSDLTDRVTNYNDLFEPIGTYKTLNEAKIALADEVIKRNPVEATSAKYSQYTLPGGENYREILIKAPEDSLKSDYEKFIEGKYGKDWNYGQLTEAEINKLDMPHGEDLLVKSDHYGDEPNILSWLRLNERQLPSTGQKVTFLEEIQSDWARKVRAEQSPDTTFKADVSGHAIKTPQHPLLKNWQELTVKKGLKEAVDSDSEYFSWITGEQTSNRYNLSTQIDEVTWKPQGKLKLVRLNPIDKPSMDILIDPRDRKIIPGGADITAWIGKPIDEVIGKGLADKIMGKESGNLSGEGLKFGGEWASNLYDKQIKDIVENLTGGKVENIDLKLGSGTIPKDAFWKVLPTGGVSKERVTPEDLKVGLTISDYNRNDYTITKLLGEKKFEAFNAYEFKMYSENTFDLYKLQQKLNLLDSDGQFNISKAMKNPTYMEAYKESYPQTFKTFTLPEIKNIPQQAIRLTPEIKAKIRGESPITKTPSGQMFGTGLPNQQSNEITLFRAGKQSEDKGIFGTNLENYAKQYASDRGDKELTKFIIKKPSEEYIYKNTSQVGAYKDLFPNSKIAKYLEYEAGGKPYLEKGVIYSPSEERLAKKMFENSLKILNKKYDYFTGDGNYNFIADLDKEITKELKKRGIKLIEYSNPKETLFSAPDGAMEYSVLDKSIISSSDKTPAERKLRLQRLRSEAEGRKVLKIKK